MIATRIDLFLTNMELLKKAKGSHSNTILTKSAALNLTINGCKADPDKINDCRRLIKENTSLFSYFRGNNIFNISVNLSMEENPSEALNQLILINSKLRKVFRNSEYLIETAFVIYKANDKIDYISAIAKTKEAYDIMKQNHLFITSSDDYASAAMIATTFDDLNSVFNDIEKCYSILKSNRLGSSNDVQGLSHILSLASGTPEEKCERVLELNKLLRRNKVPLRQYSLPFLAIPTLFTNDNNDFCNDYIDTINYLKEQRGFGTLILRNDIRNMIAVVLVSSSYAINSRDMDHMISATNTATLSISIALQMAMTSVIIASSVAASSYNS